MRSESLRGYGLLLLLCAAVLAGSGCSTNAPPYSAAQTPTPETVFVLPFDVVASAEYEGPTDFGSLLAEYVAGALQAKGVAAIAVPRGEPRPDARLVVSGKITTLDPGSWNLRFWIGFGAGRALVDAEAQLTAAGETEPRYEQSLRARSLTWQFQENILRRVCAKLARTLAKEIVSKL